MSKKIIAIFLLVALMLSLCACGKEEVIVSTNNQTQTDNSSNTDKKDEVKPRGNYTNDFQFTGSEDDFKSDKYKQANFKQLYLSTERAYGVQEITISNSLVTTDLNNSIVELTAQKTNDKKGIGFINSIIECEDFYSEFSAEYDFRPATIPISAKIKIRPYNVSTQEKKRPQLTTMDYLDSKMVCTAQCFKSMTFQYNHSMSIENQSGMFSFQFERNKKTDDYVLNFGHNIKSITVQGITETKSNITATYQDGKIVLVGDASDFSTPELIISIIYENDEENNIRRYDVRDAKEFIITPTESGVDIEMK